MFPRLALLAALATSPAAAEVTLINVFEVPQGQQDAVIAQWEAARDLLQDQPGYVRTALHAALDPTARFALINIAIWESPDHFQNAMAVLRASDAYPAITGLGINPALYTVIRNSKE
ncbi:MAG: antibiotic biosynthesis monooxygenase family protein [Roseinatronobacter sp.]